MTQRTLHFAPIGIPGLGECVTKSTSFVVIMGDASNIMDRSNVAGHGSCISSVKMRWEIVDDCEQSSVSDCSGVRSGDSSVTLPFGTCRLDMIMSLSLSLSLSLLIDSL